MTQEKMRKLITACAAAATMLIVFLLGVLIYQGITFAVLSSREKALKEENAALQQQYEQNLDNAEYFESVMGKEWLAFQKGFFRKGD